MKKLLLFFMLALCSSMIKAGYIQHLVDKIPETKFKQFSLFTAKQASIEKDILLKKDVRQYQLLNIDVNILKEIANAKPQYLEINIPINGVWETMQLIPSKGINEQTIFSENKGKGKETVGYKLGAYYQGVIKGKANTFVAISFFDNDVIGVAANDDGNYVIGRSDKHDFTRSEYIVFNDHHLLVSNLNNCGVEDNNLPAYNAEASPVSTSLMSTNCVKLYIECEYQFYLDNGSNVTTATNFATGIFNLVQAMYVNDSINTGLSQLVIWTVTDPYASATNTNIALNLFGAEMASGFNGDLAHLFVNRGIGGGLAWVDQLCFSSQYATAVSASLDNTYTPLPTYSWNANVVTHEMGHNIGSNHTHSCVWNGNNTRIDNCGGHAGYPSGSCADVNPDPPGGGTQMSYCHLVGVGINMNLGFGTQPGNLIRNYVSIASCLTPCIVCQTNVLITGTFSSALTESDTWIASSGQTTIPSTSSVKLDAEPNNGYVLLEPTSNTDFFLANPNSSNYFVAQTLDGCGGSSPARLKGNAISSLSSSSFVLYPNPANNIITIKNEDITAVDLRYEIISMDGKVLQAATTFFDIETTLDISALATGLYFLKVYHGNEMHVMKFQKQ